MTFASVLRRAAGMLCAALLLLPVSAQSQLRVMPPIELGPTVDSVGARGQDDPSAAFDGQNYFVVWTDWREHDVAGAVYVPGGLRRASG